MVPTLVPDDRLLVRYGASYAPGDVVLIQRTNRIDVKRVQEISDDGVFVVGDNELLSLDSRSYGLLNPEQIVAKVIMRLWPKPGHIAIAPQV